MCDTGFNPQIAKHRKGYKTGGIKTIQNPKGMSKIQCVWEQAGTQLGQAQPGLGLDSEKFYLNIVKWGFGDGQNILLGPTNKI